MSGALVDAPSFCLFIPVCHESERPLRLCDSPLALLSKHCYLTAYGATAGGVCAAATESVAVAPSGVAVCLVDRGQAMLVLSRKVGEKILIGDNIAVTVVRVAQGSVRIGVEAPDNMEIVREEIKGQGKPRAVDRKVAGRS